MTPFTRMTGRVIRNALLFLLLAVFGWFSAIAGPDEDWAAIEHLDAGPPQTPKTRQEALSYARTHLIGHRTALRTFLQRYPDDPRAVDARLRLASIAAAQGSMEGKQELIDDALRQLMTLEKDRSVPHAKQADIAFRRISLQMQTTRGRPEKIRETVVTAARNYADRFADDRRAPRLLVEAATLCDAKTMRALLEQAQTLSREPALNARIADDLKRLDRLGAKLDLRFNTLQGSTVDLASLRGNVVVLLFWSADSPHSQLWLRGFRDSLRKIPSQDLRIISVSLDESRAAVESTLRELDANWPTHFDGKGWNNEIARPLGINAVPTVWILDKRGALRVINARDNYEIWIRNLLREQ
jgi:hypothetical protein